MRTQVRNRVHAILARQRSLDQPPFSDLFGTKGKAWLEKLRLTPPDDSLLQQQLALLELLDTQTKQLEKEIEAEHGQDPMARRIQTIPGMGKILAPVVACEIEAITLCRHRFHGHMAKLS